jgi:hypothetical protein
MFTSAELIEALHRRQRRSLRPLPAAGEYPPGWRAWFAALRERMGTIRGATAEAMVALLAGRELRLPPPRMPALNDWQAFATLWRQQWHPASSEDRGVRIAALAIALLSQLFIAIFLLWLAYARYGGEPEPPRGEDVVQVEFIGDGTPEDQGGGAASGPAPEPAAADAPAASGGAAVAARPSTSQTSTRRITEVALAPSAPIAPSRVEPALVPPEAPATSAQPVQVTEAPPVEDAPFVLPPPTPRVVDLPRAAVKVPELAQQARDIEMVEVPTAPTTRREVRVPTASVTVPELDTRVETLPAPPQPLAGAAVVAREATLPRAEITVPGLAVEPGALPMGSRRSAEADGQGQGQAPGSGETASLGTAADAGSQGAGADGNAARAGGTAVAGTGGGQAAGTNRGAGSDPLAPPGAWPGARPGDDWGLSDRYQAGGQAGSGLFDENGRPRLPPEVKPEAGGGLPPGTVTADIEDLDREGTWLKRPPIGYDPTRFDRYWLPGGNLLEEWVRRGIKEVTVRIPGTTKNIHCVVSLLALGGACGVDDPDMQDQEAEARPPPDIPWKPELQDDQDAL